MRTTIVLALSLAGLMFLGSCSSVYAIENDIGQSQIHPAHPLYFLKSIREILELKFSGTSHVRGLRYFEFAQRRIREVKTLISVNRPDLIPPTLEKYWLSVEKLLGLINFREVLGPQVIDKLGKHVLILEELFNQTENKQAKIAIRATIYRISRFNEQLLERLPLEEKVRLSSKITKNQIFICNYLSKEASTSGLNDIEKLVLVQRAQRCFKSLGSGHF